MQKKNLAISYELYSSIDELDSIAQNLCRESVKAMETSHSPYSGFRVGVAVLLESGRVVYGSNQENVAYPSGLCAERVALFTIGSTYPDDRIISMAEYEKKQVNPIDVMFYCLNGSIIRTSGVKSLLPFAFAETRLKK